MQKLCQCSSPTSTRSSTSIDGEGEGDEQAWEWNTALEVINSIHIFAALLCYLALRAGATYEHERRDIAASSTRPSSCARLDDSVQRSLRIQEHIRELLCCYVHLELRSRHELDRLNSSHSHRWTAPARCSA